MGNIMRVFVNSVELILNCENLKYTICAFGAVWGQAEAPAPHICRKDGSEMPFVDADDIWHEYIKSGVGEGVLSRYEWAAESHTLETLVWIEYATQVVHFELIPREGDTDFKKIFWPGAFFFAGSQENTCVDRDYENESLSDQQRKAAAMTSNTSNRNTGKSVAEFCTESKAVMIPNRSTGEAASTYTVLPLQQGLLIPDNWENEVKKLPFDGQFCSAAAYMPWFGQVAGNCGYMAVSREPAAEGRGQMQGNCGYIAICETPWDAGYEIDHPAGGPYTRVEPYFLSSLGKLSYRRNMRYHFLNDCDYNDLCKVYRSYVRETGLFTTLREKAAHNPRVDDLIGSVIVHKGIKTHVSPDSAFYEPGHPEKNDVLIPFAARSKEIRRYHEMGVRKLYLHLDGWGAPGYDNKHPDYLPACPEAGGWEGLKELSDTILECDYLFGLHDQYRDYYTDAASYDREYAVHAPDGSVFEMARWAGGRQNYLCATQAPYYVKRNFEEVLSHGIRLQASYLDVFTCNEPDECAHPRHRMSRKECLEYREACFAYLTSKGILPSSEECGDWAMRELVFCHYGPYDFMLDKPGSPRRGIPVPLFNLVYHDCMILPWFMDRQEREKGSESAAAKENGDVDEIAAANENGDAGESAAAKESGDVDEGSGVEENGRPDEEGEDYMLYALLNGGVPYLDRDGAYPDTDGVFDSAARRKLAEDIARCAQVTALHERVAKCEMVRHEFPDGNPAHQRTTFSDGTQVTVWLERGEFEIFPGDEVTEAYKRHY